MSLPPAEERKLQRTKIDQLDYISFLLELLLHKIAPGNMDFEPFQEYWRAKHARSKQSAAEVHGDLRTQSPAREGGVSQHDA